MKNAGAGRLRRTGSVLEAPGYSVAEAALYLSIPKATLRYWAMGARYPTKSGRADARPLMRTPERGVLSFCNLVEAHVLDALRRDHQVSLQAVRRALAYVAKRFPSDHPLLDLPFETAGLELFVERYGALIKVSGEGQAAMRELLRAHLRRVERDESGIPVRLYPYTRGRALDEPRAIVIDPRIQFGRPVLVGTGIPTEVIADRFRAGESPDDLAHDYGRTTDEIQEALRAELGFRAAA
jgi:uncharacterized protein (DUF433 family)